MKILSYLGLFLFISCTNRSLDNVDFLIGTWKIENQNQYETWTKTSENKLSGYSYEFIGNQKKVLETIAIKMINDQMIYEATVPSQNEGQTIQFVLNPEINSYFSFENPSHDFPKIIQYKKISEKEIMISVLGDDGKSFTYKMIKQEEE